MKTKTLYKRLNTLSPHPFPHNLCISILRYIQGMGASMMIADNAAHLFFANYPNAYEMLVERALKTGMEINSWETTWECYVEFIKETPNPSVQTFFISLTSSWDWFIDQLGCFISFCEEFRNESETKLISELRNIHKKPVEEQFNLLEKVISISDISEANKNNICELFLLRNLGVHKGWVVDKEYLRKTKRHGFKEGDLIVIDSNIVLPFQKSVNKVITKLSSIVASKYAECPDYE